MSIVWTYAFGGSARLARCRKAATVAEYAIAAGLAVAAWGASDSSRLHGGGNGCTVQAQRGVAFRWDKDAVEAAARPCRTGKPLA